MRPTYDTEREPQGEGGYIVQCHECGKEFEAVRYDASFCSSTCRSRNYRASKQLDKDIDKAKHLINDLIHKMPLRGESKSYKALLAIRNRIDSALSVVESET